MTHAKFRFLITLLMASGIVACSSSKKDQPAAKNDPVAVAPSASTDAVPQPPAAGKALLEATPLTRGGESLRVFLDDEKLLHVGTQTITVDHVDPDEYAWKSQAALKVVEFDGQRSAVLLTTPIAEEEDPPNRHQLFLIEDGSLRRVFDRVVGSYGIHPVQIPGDGTVRYVEDGWAACERTKHPAVATQQEVIFRLADPKAEMAEAERKDTSEKMKCDELAACPFVYVMSDDGEASFVGEILRNMRGRDAFGLQSLSVPGAATDTLRLRIVEEKAETTFLDELYVEVAGVRVQPLACEATVAPAYCRADHNPLVLRQGDMLDVELHLPAGSQSTDLQIFARGYYIPTPTAHLRSR